MSESQVIVIGAGPAGLSTALALKDEGIESVVFDRAPEVASSWRARYDRLRLNSPARMSHLPGRRFAKGTETFPGRDDVIAHLEEHAAEDGFELRLGTAVNRVDRSDSGWVLTTSAGEERAPHVVVATGHEHSPYVPDWRGRESFGGDLLHSSRYREPGAFTRRRALVAGSGCSGMEIAFDLVEGGAAKVWLAVRTPPNIILRTGPGGLPGDYIGGVLSFLPTGLADRLAKLGRRMDLGDLTEYGLPFPDEGIFARLNRLGVAPAIVDKPVIDAIRGGRIEIVRGVESLDEAGVTLADGVRVEPDAVICATGFRRGLEELVGHLEVLGERGLPKAIGGHAAQPGLRFVGYVPRPGMLHRTAKDAGRAARAIKRELAG